MNHPIIDVCVHHHWSSQAELMPYLSRAWQEYLRQPEGLPGGVDLIPLLPMFPFHHPAGDKLADSGTADAPPGTSLDRLREQLLDRGPVEQAVLTHDAGMFTPTMANPDLAVDVARAINDWTLDRWTSRDDRLSALILVPNQTPERAAAEIERLADQPAMVGVLMAANGLSKPFGHPAYEPILAAAAAHGLPIVIHAGGDAVPETLTHTTSGGLPTTFAEYSIFKAQAMTTHLVSLIAQAVFERHPTLKVLFSGAGAGWLPSLVWRFDTEYSAYRRETPAVKRKPSEYVRDHVRVSTHPFDVAPSPEQLVRFLRSYRGMEDVLVYGSGYPDWDTDWPADLDDRIPPEWRAKVFHDNAAGLLRPRAAVAGAITSPTPA